MEEVERDGQKESYSREISMLETRLKWLAIVSSTDEVRLHLDTLMT